MDGGRRAALEARLRDAVRSGQLAEGARLPSTRAYADELGLSRGTVSAAFAQLVAEGYLLARPGAGTFVAPVRTPAAATASASSPVRRSAPPRLDLRPGTPDPAAFPVAAWLRASRRALTDAAPSSLGYGDPRGRLELRVALADYLGRARGVVTTPDTIVVTTSYAQSLSLTCEVIGAGDVAMEDPGLPFHRDIVRRHGLRVLPVPVDESGLVVAGLAAQAVVTTAAHQYPTGVTLAPLRRAALARWAHDTGGLVLEDDYDGEFRYDRSPIGAVQGTAPDHVVYAGTAAKTLGPAVRLGWIAVPPRLLDAYVEAKLHADHHTDTLQQLTLAELVRTHAYDRHVRAARARYRRRRDLLLRELDGLDVVVRGASAGLQAMVLLPAHAPAEDEVVALGRREGLALAGLAEHWHRPGDHPHGLLIGFGAAGETAYPAAVSLLRRTLGRALGQPGAAAAKNRTSSLRTRNPSAS